MAATETTPSANASQEVVIPLYSESIEVGKREVDAGTVHIKKVVTTETVNQPVELRRETVSVTRIAQGGTPTTQAGQAFQAQDFSIPLKREEAVIGTRVVESGRVVASKQFTSESTNIQHQIRREDIAVDNGGNPRAVATGDSSASAANTSSSAVGGAGSPGAESRGTGSSSGTITDLSTLSSVTDASTISGREVQLSSVKVQQVVAPTVIAVTAEGMRSPAYVHLQQPIDSLKVGDKVKLTGRIQEPSKITELSSLDSTSSQLVSSRPFVIEAQSAEIANE
jgi:uncharacterized protein (TIGR02271 family)